MGKGQLNGAMKRGRREREREREREGDFFLFIRGLHKSSFI